MHAPDAQIPVLNRAALSPKEAADVLGCSRQHIYSLIGRGELIRYKVGRSTKLNTAEVLALVGGGGDDAAS
jgi:excisionase family DNA binding protein